MKKIFSFLAMAMISMSTMAQQPVITFEKTEHDFGKINEADGRVTTVFTFKNEGMEPLTLTSVRASCGCTTPKYTSEPVDPGQTGQITVTYNPNGRPGRFHKTITVNSNASEPVKKLYIKGEVIPKSAEPVDQYPVKMGELSLKSNQFAFGELPKGVRKHLEVEYANQTDHVITVELLANPKDNYLISQATLQELQPKETGKFVVAFDTEACKLYGPVEAKLYVIVNGKKEISEKYKLTVNANIVEDFSRMTVADRQQAPIIEMSDKIDLGVIAADKKIKKNISVKNAGTHELLIHRVVTTDAILSATTPKAIKGGKKGDIVLLVNTTGLKPATYERLITIIANDPKQSIHKVSVVFTIQ